MNKDVNLNDLFGTIFLKSGGKLTPLAMPVDRLLRMAIKVWKY